MDGWKKLDEVQLLDNKRVPVYEDKVEFPDGTQSYYVKIPSGDVTTVVVFNKELQKYLVNLEYEYMLDDRIHRNSSEDPFDGWVYKFPGGQLKPNESAENGAKREIEEETGYKVGKMVELGKVRNYFPRMNSIDTKFYAETSIKGEIDRDQEEFNMQVHMLDRSEIEYLVKSRDRRVMHAYFLDTWMMYSSQF